MGDYQIPADVPVSCDWQCHRDRPNGGSPEPGTDYGAPYGTDIAMAGDGVVSVVDHDNGGGEGRRLSVDLDDGRRVSYLHLSEILVPVGTRVVRGAQGVALSGASGNGEDWYYGPHVHVSLWEAPGMPYRETIDFELYVGDDMSKQDIKDAMFEFYRDTTTPPPGMAEWPFFRYAVWESPVTAQDGNGYAVVDPDGKPVTFAASGYLANTNAQVTGVGKVTRDLGTMTRRAPWVIALALLAVVAAVARRR